jgi:hypothetical protein
VSILLLDVVNNNSKVSICGKKNLKIKERSVPNFFKKRKEKKRKSQNNKLPINISKTRRACNFHQKNRKIFTGV